MVSIVNPMQIRAFGQSEFRARRQIGRTLALIARFCQAMNPSAWEPPTACRKTLTATGSASACAC